MTISYSGGPPILSFLDTSSGATMYSELRFGKLQIRWRRCCGFRKRHCRRIRVSNFWKGNVDDRLEAFGIIVSYSFSCRRLLHFEMSRRSQLYATSISRTYEIAMGHWPKDLPGSMVTQKNFCARLLSSQSEQTREHAHSDDRSECRYSINISMSSRGRCGAMVVESKRRCLPGVDFT